MTKTKKNFHQLLKELREEPERQASLALEILDRKDDRQLTVAALRVLIGYSDPSARKPLLDLYQDLAANGEKRDPGGEIRALTIRALRSIARPEDFGIFEDAASRYEFLPPSFKEEAGPLRAAGVIALADLDDEKAKYYAAKLLVEKYTDPMSGEPAVSAARVLASQGEEQCLYQYLFQEPETTLPEITSECLRLLTPVPESLIPGLVDRFLDSDNDLILAGLLELLVRYQSGFLYQDQIAAFVSETDRYEVYHFLVALIIAESRSQLLPYLLPILKDERDKRKAALLIELLTPFESDTEINEIIMKLKKVVR